MIIDKLFKTHFSSKGDSAMKSLLKTISWRILGTLDTVFIAYFISGNIEIALSIGSVEIVSKMILYYFHERLWNKINMTYDKGKVG